MAILSNDKFDAPSRTDQTSLRFGRRGDEESFDFCVGDEDVNNDGLLDLVCHFNTQSSGFQQGDVQGIISGQTLDGAEILGSDSVRILEQ